jgi:hypothetical protein
MDCDISVMECVVYPPELKTIKIHHLNLGSGLHTYERKTTSYLVDLFCQKESKTVKSVLYLR